MGQFQEFVVDHALLWSALLVVLVALAVNEAVRMTRGQRPIPATEAVRLMNAHDAVVVDIRSAADYKKHHILGAVHIPLAGIEERAREISKQSQRTIIVYCGVGNQAPQAAAKLKRAGYSDVHALKGGINAWQSDGLPVTTK